MKLLSYLQLIIYYPRKKTHYITKQDQMARKQLTEGVKSSTENNPSADRTFDDIFTIYELNVGTSRLKTKKSSSTRPYICKICPMHGQRCYA